MYRIAAIQINDATTKNAVKPSCFSNTLVGGRNSRIRHITSGYSKKVGKMIGAMIELKNPPSAPPIDRQR